MGIESPAPQNCPVGFTARHAGHGTAVKVSPENRDRPGLSTQLPAPGRALRRAGQGHPPRPRRRPGHARRTDGIKPDATETFTVTPSTEPNHLFHSVVYVHKLTGVLWIQINELTFADGTTWHESADSICRATPKASCWLAPK